jgi:hypothetical protein
VRVGRKYRALAIAGTDRFQWFWIGTHAEYNSWFAEAGRGGGRHGGGRGAREGELGGQDLPAFLVRGTA